MRSRIGISAIRLGLLALFLVPLARALAEPPDPRIQGEAGRTSEDDPTEVLYLIYTSTPNDHSYGPPLKFNCPETGGRITVSHVMRKKPDASLDGPDPLRLSFQLGADRLTLKVRPVRDELNGFDVFTHLHRRGSRFMAMLRADKGVLHITEAFGRLKPIEIDLTGHRALIDRALALCGW